jgi:hypothetical protein
MTAYGMAKWPDRLARIPQAHEGAIIARVQSMRTRGGHVPEPLSFAESQAYLRRVDRVRKRGVTVPQPLCQPAPQQRTTPPSRGRGAGWLHSGDQA